MRNVFTKFLMVSAWVTMAFSLSFAQNLNTLTVNAPAGLAGDYTLARPTWGSQSNNSITADAVYAEPVLGCESLTNNGSGKIVFVDRGTCAFDVKALNAKNAGAVAVIICQNVPAPEPLFLMAAGNVAAQVNIPVFLATQETCNKLRVDLTAGGVNATIGFKCNAPTYASNVVWGTNPGEGDFSNGLNGWTTDKGWVANPEGIVRLGAYTGTPRVVGSSTSCNGVAEFNSDHLDNKSVAGAFGTGDCPAPCTGYLLSPNITLAQPLTGLVIEFNQSLRQFQSQYYIMVSTDGGATFRDTVRFNTEYPVNSAHITERKRIAFSDFGGTTQIRFKFEIIANYYYWAIDDIVVYDENTVDMQVNRDWYSVSPYYKMPKDMVSEIPFMADISNLGNSGASDVVLNVNVNGPSTNRSFELIYGDVAASSIWENRPFPAAFKSPANVGTYTAEYFVTSAEEEDGPNNRAGFQWKVTEKTFGNLDTEADFGSAYMAFYASPWLSVPDSKIYSCGNAYFVPNVTGYVATKARYGLANPIDEVREQNVRIDLFEWDDADNSGTAEPSERTRVGTNFQTITDDIADLRNIETDIWAADEDGFALEGERVTLKPNTHYLVAASVTPNAPETDPQMQLLGFTPRALDAYNRSIGHILATNFALDSLEALGALTPRASGSLQAWENTVNTSVEDIDMRNFRFIFNGALYTKSHVELDVALKTNTAEPTLPTVAVKTFPNPAARDLFVDINLNSISQQVDIYMYDVEGKLVSTRNLNNIKEDRVKLDVSTLTNGVYNVRVVTAEGVATRKVVIQN